MMKNGTFSLLAIFLLGGCLWSAGAAYVRWQQTAIASELRTRIEDGEAREALSAIEQLVNLRGAGVAELVRAAGDDRNRVRKAARNTIGQTVEDLRLNAATQESHDFDYYERVAAALANQLEAFDANGQRWARQTAVQLLELSGRSTVGIVQNCDWILGATGHLDPSTASNEIGPDPAVAIVDPPPSLPPLFDLLNSPAGDDTLAEPSGVVPTKLREGAVRIARSPAPKAPTAAARGPVEGQAVRRRSPDSLGPQPKMLEESETKGAVSDPTWLPLSQTAPKSPSTDRRSAVENKDFELPLNYRVELTRQLQKLDGSQLLRRWIASPTVERPVLEQEMSRRNLSKLPMPIAESLVSSDHAQRLKAIDLLLRATGVEAGPWLAEMTDDTHPDVRLAAVSLLSTSEDPQLIDKAWHAAIHDRDPRVAKIARTIQLRRDDAVRR